MTTLFDKALIGNITVNNRVVMSPLTRCRSGANRVPNHLMAEYYRERANQKTGAGLIISEAISISPQAVGYPDTPGLWNKEQTEGWKQITEIVHSAGGKIVAQLWHVGRISDPELLNGQTPVSSSAVRPKGQVSLLRPKRDYVTPKQLEISEIDKTIQDYRQAAINAQIADFDGVEIHAANGYLPDQFLSSNANLRTDKYGGSIENHARFLLEVVDSVCEVCPAIKVGVHLSPLGLSNDIVYKDANALFIYLARELSTRKIGFMFVREPISSKLPMTKLIRPEFTGFIIANDGYKIDDAKQVIKDGVVDAVSFGRDFICNPDLTHRLKNNLPLNSLDAKTLFSHGIEDKTKGYTDYPSI